MKYKILTIILIIFLIIVSALVNNFYKDNLAYVYHQHLEDNSSEEACQEKNDCSHLPIINILTNNQTIPVKNQLDSTAIDYIITDVLVSDNHDNVNYLNKDEEKYKARLRYRGRSSLHFDKKGYSLKFVNDNNEKINKKFLGMSSDSEWVLHGPFIDKSLIRNYMWYNISQEITGNAPKVRFFELYLDNDYQGLYLAAEAVTQSENSRVKMKKIDKNSIATSYMLLLDSDFGTTITHLDSYTKYTYDILSPIYLTIKYPLEEDLNEKVRKYIYDDFNQFEKMLYSFDYHEYEKYIDVSSFVDYFIINEFTQNYDAGWLSTYIYKDIFGKYKMYPWDFNSANNNYHHDLLKEGMQGFEFDKSVWFKMLLKDKVFIEKIITRYQELRKTYLSDKYLNNYIDDTVKYLGHAVDRNFTKWGYTLDQDYNAFLTNYMPTSYDDAIRQLKDAIKKRATWLDKNIYTLRQYSHASKNKKINN